VTAQPDPAAPDAPAAPAAPDASDASDASALSIRPANRADLPAVLALWRTATQPSHTDDIDSLGRLLERDAGALLVAEDGDGHGHGIVGSIMATFDGWRGTVHRLAVAPPYRRSGLGRRLLVAGEERLDALGVVRMQAIVIETDDTALAFWRATDWEEQTERIRFTKG
jgi:ribosomal protein S18 acetylase RimI-like enzyme